MATAGGYTFLEKPAHGQPCNNCGKCCENSLCPIAERIFGAGPGPCPALLADIKDGVVHSACGMIASPESFVPVLVALHGKEKLAAAAALVLGSGLGCDARETDDEPIDPGLFLRAQEFRRRNARALDRAVAMWKL